jgi:hypothetical protein
MVARALIAWELGEAFGHHARCLRLAEGLRQRGYAVTLALKDVRLPVGQCVEQGFTVLPAAMTPQGAVGPGSADRGTTPTDRGRIPRHVFTE